MPSPGTKGLDGLKCSTFYGIGGNGGDAGTGVSECVCNGGQNPTYMDSWCTFDCNYEAYRTCVCDVICPPGANGSGGEGGGAGGMGGKKAPLFTCFIGDYYFSWGDPGDDGSAGDPGWVCINF